jgi:outer membrane protein TolC
LQQAQYRYKAGLVTYLEVATTENTSLQAKLAAVTIQQRRMNASVLLVKALGGGWQSFPENADPSAVRAHALGAAAN